MNGHTISLLFFSLVLRLGYVAPALSGSTGGTITDVGGYRIHTFTSSGSFFGGDPGTAEVLVVAGGGSGGNSNSSNANGGGGGGGLISTTFQMNPADGAFSVGS